ncbi:MAG TPA: altronate dehydratase family protein [Saprospiraceae bacterium]|nr:altronate dehydratase family protein [Saprospiraceae bacterium]
MIKKIAKIHPTDNVLVALQNLKAGDEIIYESDTIVLLENIEAKHKFFTSDLKKGGPIIMYGVKVGYISVDQVFKGQWMNTSNTSHATDKYSWSPQVNEWQAPRIDAWKNKTFEGYIRSDGQVGTANYWLFIPTVFCENRNLDVIKNALNEALGYGLDNKYKSYASALVDAYKVGKPINALQNIDLLSNNHTKSKVFNNIDGIKYLSHNGGCGGTHEDAAILGKLLASYANHPNVGGITLLSLGCQRLQIHEFLENCRSLHSKFDKPILVFEQQKIGSESLLIEQAIKETFESLIELNKQTRQTAPISKLTIGMECGGSDGFSGISANPAVGHAADLLVACGGAVILSEFPELCGAEQNLLDRCNDRENAEKFIQLMESYNASAHAVGSGFHANPSPGNVRDGLITDAIKSMGACKKGGTSVVSDVLDYTEVVKKPGLNLLCTPGNDVESTTGLAASGANIILFTTGLGTPTGNPVCPVIKISSNTTLAEKMKDIIDINAGQVIDGVKTIEEMGEEILTHCIEVASGRIIPKAVQLQQDDFIPWKRGVSL